MTGAALEPLRWLKSLQARPLIAAVLLVLVLIWSATFVTGNYLYERQKEFLVAQQRSAATVYAEVIAQKVDERIRALAALARQLDAARLHQPGYAQQYLLDRYLLPLQFSAGAVLLDRDGVAVGDYPVMHGRKGASYADRDYFKQARATGRVVVSSPIKARVLRQTVVTFAAPIRDAQGEFAGALVGALDITSPEFLGLLSSARAMGNNEFYLVDRSEKLVVASSDPTRIMAPLLNNDFSRHLQQDEVLFFAENRLGIEKIYAIAQVAQTDWKLVIALPTEIAFASSRAMRNTLNGAALLCTLIGVVLAAWMSRRQLARLKNQNEALESTIRQRTQEVQDLYDQAPCGYHSVDTQGVVLQVNQTELDYLGYARAEFLGKSIYGFLSEASAQKMRATFPGFLQRGEICDLELDFVCKDGSTRPFRISANLVRGAQGQVLYTRSTLTDDRERQRQEQQMQTLYSFLQDVVEKLPFGLLVFDGQHRIVLHNRLLSDLLQLPPDFFSQGEVLHSTLLAFKHARGDYGDTPLQTVVASYTQSLESRAPMRLERVYGNGRSFEVLGQPLLTDHMVVTYTDTTRQKEIEREILASKALAEAATLAKSQFLANMSHEIRTPMNGILGLSYVLQKMELAEEAQRLVHRIQQTGRTLQSILNDILDFSKIEANQMTLEQASFTLEDVLDSVSSLMLGDPLRPAVELAIAPPLQPLPALNGDGLRLGQVLINLVGNAIKFTHQGFVRLSVTRLERADDAIGLQFSVQDTGIGMSAAVMDEIFKPFSQADASMSRRYGGTGLGLSISRRLVELMGGTLLATSTEGVGSEFTFSLVLPRSDVAPGLKQGLQQLELLIADDSEVAREALRNTALSLGWKPTLVNGGEAAVQQVLRRKNAGLAPEVLLIDWKMPDLDGLGVASHLRTEAHGPHGPIIILTTAHAREELLAQPQSRYVDAVLNKPVSASSLFDAVVSALHKRGRLGQSALTVAGNRLAGLHLLVVDDSDVNREVARLIFEGEGARVSLAGDGQQALDWLQARSMQADQAEQADLVLMDVQMPHTSGIDAARRIKADARWRALPIIALTAGAFAKDRDDALAAGMVDFIAKPMDVERALELILAHRPRALAREEAGAQSASRAAPARTDYPGLDLPKALKMWRAEDKYRTFLGRFVAEYRPRLAALQTLEPASRDALVHKMAGAAGSLALTDLAMAGRAYADRQHAGADPASALRALQQQAAVAWDSARRYLDGLPREENLP